LGALTSVPHAPNVCKTRAEKSLVYDVHDTCIEPAERPPARRLSRVAIVVGGASGIGLATASALAHKGCTIAIADVAGSDAAAKSLAGQGHRAYSFDISDESAVMSLFDAVERELGSVGVFVSCAGISGYVDGKRPALRDTTVENWNRVFAVNCTGAFLCVREMFRRRAAHPVEHGRIVLTGSMAALDGGKNSPSSYVASKGAVHALVKTAMNEAAALRMTVNCVAPGVVDTPMFRSAVPAERRPAVFAQMPFGRAGTPEEIGAVIAFLASEDASFISGACIDVNGGVRMT
jgi:3-oxoacyl-[acyl-carrier protein] reductase